MTTLLVLSPYATLLLLTDEARLVHDQNKSYHCALRICMPIVIIPHRVRGSSLKPTHFPQNSKKPKLLTSRFLLQLPDFPDSLPSENPDSLLNLLERQHPRAITFRSYPLYRVSTFLDVSSSPNRSSIRQTSNFNFFISRT